MAFVKLDCGILDSTLWLDRNARDLFLTALLMSVPWETDVQLETYLVESNEPAGWMVPPGEYGFVAAAGPGIARRAGVDWDVAASALRSLAEPDLESRTPDHEGRRMVRVSGGYVILNWAKYRARDHAAADRSRRYRQKSSAVTPSRVTTVTERDVTRDDRDAPLRVTHAEAEAEAEREHGEQPAAQAPLGACSSLSEDTGQPGEDKRGTSTEGDDLARWYRENYLARVDPHFKGYRSRALSKRERKAAARLLRDHGGRQEVERVALAVMADQHPPTARGWEGWAKVTQTVASLEENWGRVEQLSRAVVGPIDEPEPDPYDDYDGPIESDPRYIAACRAAKAEREAKEKAKRRVAAVEEGVS